ncbi:hypothetical protein K490DRAFT_53566 [Saccharata proteae CBS 121410]|uniref:Uncharacterized protein n=1 Tax=Saccharata proteae CBS 121410 TaxID=1314787 RepID=A0A9P4LXG9_9PEZI|nr:hypothetical protein K490DRAFT_53566 [Saccharata proteae CBS 121410]
MAALVVLSIAHFLELFQATTRRWRLMISTLLLCSVKWPKNAAHLYTACTTVLVRGFVLPLQDHRISASHWLALSALVLLAATCISPSLGTKSASQRKEVLAVTTVSKLAMRLRLQSLTRLLRKSSALYAELERTSLSILHLIALERSRTAPAADAGSATVHALRYRPAPSVMTSSDAYSELSLIIFAPTLSANITQTRSFLQPSSIQKTLPTPLLLVLRYHDEPKSAPALPTNEIYNEREDKETRTSKILGVDDEQDVELQPSTRNSQTAMAKADKKHGKNGGMKSIKDVYEPLFSIPIMAFEVAGYHTNIHQQRVVWAQDNELPTPPPHCLGLSRHSPSSASASPISRVVARYLSPFPNSTTSNTQRWLLSRVPAEGPGAYPGSGVQDGDGKSHLCLTRPEGQRALWPYIRSTALLGT